jgi:DoxX-like family
MFVLTAILSTLLAVAIGASAVRKINPGKDSLELRDRLGAGERLWAAVGVPEALAALGLVAGLWWAYLGVAAAIGVVLLMTGAVVMHLRVRFLGAALVPPLAVLAFAAVVATLRAATA